MLTYFLISIALYNKITKYERIVDTAATITPYFFIKTIFINKFITAPKSDDIPTSFVFFSPTYIEPKKDTKLLNKTPISVSYTHLFSPFPAFLA